MVHSYPIYTAKTECQDCYKCVRHCPVKAIKIEDGRAAVMPERCIGCGQCVEVCPARAKKVRDDSERLHGLITKRSKVIVSLAPSWVNEFQGVAAETMITALKLLGFSEVSETALGAQIVSASTAKRLRQHHQGVIISSACPVTVDYIRKYQPNFKECIANTLSPALTHAKMLKNMLGNDVAVVFIGPCIAKKNEADTHPELLDLALTFTELNKLLKAKNIDLNELTSSEDAAFFPERAQEGVVYPIEGGMNKTISAVSGCEHVTFSDVTGINNINQTFDGLNPYEVKQPVFIETLACFGGCVHGPCTQHKSAGLLERLRITNSYKLPNEIPLRKVDVEIEEPTVKETVLAEKNISNSAIRAALQSIGKVSVTDELNCGGCGYDTCRNFAAALIREKAEPSMCVSFMRKQAQKKANALLRCIPSGVVIVDKFLSVIECNRRFAELFGEDTLVAFDAKPGLGGADLTRLVSFFDLFKAALNSGKDIHRDSLRVNDKLFNITVFTIDPSETVGAVIMDVTRTELHREQIAERAREVINKNLSTVQDIACKLGEHMAETEILLRSISEDYADEQLLQDIKKGFKLER